MYDVIVVGAGAAGCAVARLLAERGKKILIVEKRNHIAGNCYDVKEEHGVLIHLYGPHIFHTDDEDVFGFLSHFTDWHLFRHKVVANVRGKYLPVPFNLHAVEETFGKERGGMIARKLENAYGAGARVPVLNLMRNEDADLRAVGEYVYDNIYIYYTMKQWGKKPEEIDPAVTVRVPVSISRDDGYFPDKYQGTPADGYTAMFAKMIDHGNIDLKLGADAKDVLAVADNRVYYKGELFDGDVVFTGPADELFGCCYGRLPYRTLDFRFEYHGVDDYQGHSVVNYTVDRDYTRITEYKHLTGQKCAGTVISKEYPGDYDGSEGQIPYYTISNDESRALYEKYRGKACSVPRFHLLGRLAQFRYYDIDEIIAEAMKLAERLL